jgi:hypothetical protein
MFSVAGLTAFHLACIHGHTVCAVTLVKLGANIDAKDDNGLTGLHHACKNAHYDLAIILIERDADMSIRSITGKSALDLVGLATIKEKLRLVGVKAESKREEARQAKIEEQRREQWLREHAEYEARQKAQQEAERIRQYELRNVRFSELLCAACDVSGEVSSILLLAEQYGDMVR